MAPRARADFPEIEQQQQVAAAVTDRIGAIVIDPQLIGSQRIGEPPANEIVTRLEAVAALGEVLPDHRHQAIVDRVEPPHPAAPARCRRQQRQRKWPEAVGKLERDRPAHLEEPGGRGRPAEAERAEARIIGLRGGISLPGEQLEQAFAAVARMGHRIARLVDAARFAPPAIAFRNHPVKRRQLATRAMPRDMADRASARIVAIFPPEEIAVDGVAESILPQRGEVGQPRRIDRFDVIVIAAAHPRRNPVARKRTSAFEWPSMVKRRCSVDATDE